jgi:hypothetical protein
MTEAVFASEDEEEFSPNQAVVIFALANAVIPEFSKNLFMSDGPGDAGNGNRKQEEPHDLQRKRHTQKSAI